MKKFIVLTVAGSFLAGVATLYLVGIIMLNMGKIEIVDRANSSRISLEQEAEEAYISGYDKGYYDAIGCLDEISEVSKFIDPAEVWAYSAGDGYAAVTAKKFLEDYQKEIRRFRGCYSEIHYNPST